MIVSPSRGPGLRHWIVSKLPPRLISKATLESIERHAKIPPPKHKAEVIPAGPVVDPPATADVALLLRACRIRSTAGAMDCRAPVAPPLARILNELARIAGPDTLTHSQLRTLLSSGRYSHADIPAQLDLHLGLDGRSFAAPLEGAPTSGFPWEVPPFWRGPIWIRLEPEESRATEVELRWGPYSKRIAPQGPVVLETRSCEKPGKPLVVTAPGWHTTVGLGRHPGAVDVNEHWQIERGHLAYLIDRAKDTLRHQVTADPSPA